ncbi:MAG: hypothetical protein ABSD74_11045 [Rhizomicrobium sp.]|jgi:hypothetical protein
MGPSVLKGLRATPRVVAAILLIAGLLLCLALNLPGQLSYDSIAQLHDGRTGVYNSWHPPVMAWMLGVADSIIPGAGLFVLFDAVLLFGALLSLLWLGPKSSRFAPFAAFICVLLPQILLFQGIVWKDVLFADCAVAGFVCIAQASAHWQTVRTRNLLLGASVGLLVLAALARQNGAVALVIGLIAVAAIAAMQSARGRGRAALIFGSTATVSAVVLATTASLALALRTPGESGTAAQFKLLETYDIIGAVKARPGLKLDRIARANPDLDALIRTDGVRLYTPQRNDTLASSADLQDELSDTPDGVISAQWVELIKAHPVLYLSVRLHVFDWTFFTPDISRCAPAFVGVEGLPAYMRDLHLSPRARPQDLWLKAYGAALTGTPAFSHLAFLLLALGELVLLLRRRTAEDVAMALLLASAIAFSLTFFVISIACDYRYLLFLDLSALTGGFYLAAVRPKMA